MRIFDYIYKDNYILFIKCASLKYVHQFPELPIYLQLNLFINIIKSFYVFCNFFYSNWKII